MCMKFAVIPCFRVFHLFIVKNLIYYVYFIFHAVNYKILERISLIERSGIITKIYPYGNTQFCVRDQFFEAEHTNEQPIPQRQIIAYRNS